MPKQNPPAPARGQDSRQKLLDAAVRLIRTKGYGATRVEDICAEAGLTKGAFFHHFPSKEALGVALAGYWSSSTGARNCIDASPWEKSMYWPSPVARWCSIAASSTARVSFGAV